ncbi:unnamed protein product [Bursaphelenchus xylophilus]|uniref:(pine wood nematode) hypothetical protein n=1 Tax=Bursaphelenchus xylophilus TaxID=6326 RepID=A0A1I7SEE5_BURXY|nr:unnamed protein product [Bursaphelenchus xylophilus]CAG9104038.1 unnamed protein product [Bursaphelenchus xylophilus]
MDNKIEKPTDLQLDNDFPLADDDSVPNEVDNVAKTPRQAQPLPREEVEDTEEKARLISQILELQNTLEDLSRRVDSVKDESLKLGAENQVLGQYIQNLMSTSPIFQPANSKMSTSMTNSALEDSDIHDQFYW